MGARVLVCGGRTFSDHDLVFTTLDRLHADNPIELVIHGDARGADRLAQTWALSNGVAEQAFKAKWNDVKGLSPRTLKQDARGRLFNPLAGFVRNEEMLRACPTHAIAFPGGNGTNDMCKRIRRAISTGQQIEFIDLRGQR